MARLVSFLATLIVAIAVAPLGAQNVTFMGVSDTHYDLRNAEWQGYIGLMNNITQYQLKWTEGGVQKSQAIRPASIVTAGGDLTESATTTQWGHWVTDFGLKGTDGLLKYPVYEAWGNHDGDNTGPIRPAIKARNEQRLQLGLISNLSANHMHYSWDVGTVHFVNMGLYGGSVSPSTGAWNDPQDSISFVAQDLAANVGASRKPVVLLQHYNMGSSSYWTADQQNALYDVVKNYNVVAVMNGHEAGGHKTWNRTVGPGTAIDCLDDNSGGFWVVQITGTQFVAGHTKDGVTWDNAFSKTITNVPEPAGAALVLIAGLGGLCRRRKSVEGSTSV